MQLEQRPRHLPAARDFIRKRRPIVHPRVTTDDDDTILPGSLTGPVTFTIISTINVGTTNAGTTTSSSSLSIRTTSTSTRSASSTTSTTTTRASSSTSNSVASTSSTARSSSSSIVSTSSPSVSVASATNSADSASSPSSDTPGGLSKGAIAAIAIGVLVILAAAAVLLGRRCMTMRRQQRRTTARWLNGFTGNPGPIIGPPMPGPAALKSPNYGPGYAFTPTVQNMSSTPMAPPASYNNVPITPGISPGTAPPKFTRTAAVRCTFNPSLPDELAIQNGETLNVQQEYDDGWALCTNSQGETGMVPVECLGLGAEIEGYASQRNSRRVSSFNSRA